MRDKLVELIQNAVGGCARHWAELIADNLLENGVRLVAPDNNVGNKFDWTPSGGGGGHRNPAVECGQLCAYNTYAKGCTVKENNGICPLTNMASSQAKPMTNGDRIRSMTDEELADFICNNTQCETCGFGTWTGCSVREWLKQPREVDHDTN